MVAATAYAPAAPALPHVERTTRAERLRLLLLWLTGASSALVFIEPSPYEIASLAAIFVFGVSGLSLRASLLPLVVLLILINIGYTVSASHLLSQTNVLTWVVSPAPAPDCCGSAGSRPAPCRVLRR
jgi:hypothetical protein